MKLGVFVSLICATQAGLTKVQAFKNTKMAVFHNVKYTDCVNGPGQTGRLYMDTTSNTLTMIESPFADCTVMTDDGKGNQSIIGVKA